MGEVAYDPTVVPEPSAELRELGERMVGQACRSLANFSVRDPSTD